MDGQLPTGAHKQRKSAEPALQARRHGPETAGEEGGAAPAVTSLWRTAVARTFCRCGRSAAATPVSPFMRYAELLRSRFRFFVIVSPTLAI